ncbi:MORN repeat-containing protein [Marinobacter sp. C2H3]|uniref:MORN repeat-containing protein n=1 Tax=Marinobacter sp. C2H3 TaxID=3119003 RepID=UPI00300E8536
MVDFRPLLFINALALMLLVTAGFASITPDGQAPRLALATEAPASPPSPEAPKAAPQTRAEDPVGVAPTGSANPASEGTPGEQVSAAAPKMTKPDASASADRLSNTADTPIATPFTLPAPAPSDVAAKAQAGVTDTRSPAPAPKPAPPTTGELVLRSNVYDDSVTINGKDYGPTRLDLTLKPGTYQVTIAKDGYRPWEQTITLAAGDRRAVTGELVEYTSVNYRNGTWVGGVRTGDGTYEDDSGLRYKGHFVDGQFQGEGTAWYGDGSRYDGHWAQGKQQGEGVWRGPDGQMYVGSFRNGRFHGKGTLTYPDGRTYEGEFADGQFNGDGVEVFADGKRYEGQFIEGAFHGKGILQNPNGSSIEATFRNGKPFGQVTLTTPAGEIFTARTTEPGVCYRDKSYRATQCPELEGW